MVPKSTKMANNAFATADLLKAIEDLDNIECGAETKKHFNIAPSYRNLNHGTFLVMENSTQSTDPTGAAISW